MSCSCSGLNSRSVISTESKKGEPKSSPFLGHPFSSGNKSLPVDIPTGDDSKVGLDRYPERDRE